MSKKKKFKEKEKLHYLASNETRWTIRLKVHDWWAPNYFSPNGKQNEVELSVINLYKMYSHIQGKTEGEVRICVWGNDNTGMELDIPVTGEKEGEEVFARLKRYALQLYKQQPLCRQYFEKVGFWPA